MLRTRTPDELLARGPRRLGPMDALRAGWFVTGLVAAAFFAKAMEMVFYLEGTSDALAEAEHGRDLMTAIAPVIVLLGVIGPSIGARWWSAVAIVPAPLVPLAIESAYPDRAITFLAALVLAPIAFVAALMGVLVPNVDLWRSRPGRTCASMPGTPAGSGASGPRHSA